jgi:hypothetical protein
MNYPFQSNKILLQIQILLLVITFAFAPILIMILYLSTDEVSAVAARVNSTTCSNASAATIGCTVTGPTNGNTMIAVIGTRGTTANRVSSITQTGATWVQASTATNANGVTVEIWYANNVTSAGTGVTVNLAATLKASAVIAEYSGLLTSGVLNQTANNTGNSTSPSTGTTGTTSQADQLWIGGMANINTSTYSAETNSFTELAESASTGGAATTRNNTVLEERIVSATGTASTAATLSATQQWAGAIATFNAVPPPTKIAYTTSARTVTAGTCSGAGNIITIQLQDSGNTARNPSGATVIRVTSNSPSETIYSDSSCSTVITNGDISFSTSENTKSFYIIDTRKSNPTWTLTAAKQSGPDTLTDGTQSITVNAGAVTRLVLTLPGETFTDGTGNSGAPTNRTAGSSFTITSISATDIYFNVNTGYSGAKTLAYSGPSNSPAPSNTAPTYTTSVSFTNGQSTTTLTTTLYRAQSTTITTTDAGSYGYASSSVTVDAGVLFDYTVSANTPITAGTCSTTSNTISAFDQWDNQRTSDTSVVNMTTSGTGITFYTNSGCGTSTTQYTLSAGTANFYYRTTVKQSGVTVTATKNLDTPTGTSSSITVNPAAASALLIRLPGQSFVDGTGITGSPNFSGLRTPNATAGVSFSIDIKAVDAYNNLVNTGPSNYTGVKTVSYAGSVAGNAPSGQTPTFPSTSPTFTNGEANGLNATYYNATTGRTFEADDTGTPVSGTASTSFTVQAGSAQNYNVSASTPQVAGVAFNVTITTRDTWNNTLGSLYSAPAGSYSLSTTNGNAPDGTSPALGTIAQGDFTNGVATKSVTLYNATSSTVTASDPGASVSGVSGSIVVNAGNISADTSDSTVTGNASVVRDSPLTVTITLRDTWRNPKVGVLAANIVVSGTTSPSVTQPGSNTDSNGQTTASLTWSSAGNQTVSIQINSVSLMQNDGTTADGDGFLDDTHVVSVTLPAGSSSVIQGGTRFQGGTRIQ